MAQSEKCWAHRALSPSINGDTGGRLVRRARELVWASSWLRSGRHVA